MPTKERLKSSSTTTKPVDWDSKSAGRKTSTSKSVERPKKSKEALPKVSPWGVSPLPSTNASKTQTNDTGSKAQQFGKTELEESKPAPWGVSPLPSASKGTKKPPGRNKTFHAIMATTTKNAPTPTVSSSEFIRSPPGRTNTFNALSPTKKAPVVDPLGVSDSSFKTVLSQWSEMDKHNSRHIVSPTITNRKTVS
jgi:hypothetical protein